MSKWKHKVSRGTISTAFCLHCGAPYCDWCVRCGRNLAGCCVAEDAERGGYRHDPHCPEPTKPDLKWQGTVEFGDFGEAK